MATFSIPSKLQQCRFVSTKILYPKQFKSVLSAVPPRPRSGWQIFLRDHLSEIKAKEGKASAPKATQLLSEQWQKFSDAEKQKYNSQYQREAKLHEDAVKKALTEATPQQIHDENILRRKYNLTLLKDPKQPKRPLNSYMLFLEHLRLNGSTEFKQLPVAQQAHEGSKKFKLLTAQEKESFDRKAKEQREAFIKANAAYKNKIN
ncbi:hypothetical protein BC941DRAFT_475797 [Chlamydoabsidia padenii]|nr:hypothetical protein BC941DRAFT_475797 [Chlamydoabsidia padenii]